MSVLVSKDYVEFNESFFNLSFIAFKGTSTTNPTSYYFRRIEWDRSARLPKSFYTLDLGTNGTHIYCPWCPFHLQEDECSSWLKWSTEKIVPEGDEIRMLKFREDPRTVFQNPDTKFGISAYIQHSLWADQLNSNHLPALGNLNRMEVLVKQTINQSLRQLPNTIANRVKNDLRDDFRDRRRPSRSPEPKNPRTEQTQQSPVIPQQQIQTPMVFPQQYYMQPQLTQQQLQWNAAVAGPNGNQTPAGLLYAPPRT
jgi:hypothetical protein